MVKERKDTEVTKGPATGDKQTSKGGKVTFWLDMLL